MFRTAVDLFLVYQFIRRLATPFTSWKAYELGIIDERGNSIRKRNTLTTPEEKAAWGIYDIMIRNIKMLIEKVPFGQTKLASYAAALYLIKEWNHFTEGSLLNENVSENEIEQSLNETFSLYLIEEPTNTISSGAISGVSPEDSFKKMSTKFLRRKTKTEDTKYKKITNFSSLGNSHITKVRKRRDIKHAIPTKG